MQPQIAAVFYCSFIPTKPLHFNIPPYGKRQQQRPKRQWPAKA
jgi:hypothetical protein